MNYPKNWNWQFFRRTKNVCPPERSAAESKDLRTNFTANVTINAKILRLASLAQDDIPFGAMLNLTNNQRFVGMV